MTYRDYVMKNLSINPFVAWFLDITFNQDNDHPLTAWEEMFYPAKLREHLATMPAFDDDGHPIPGSKLLVDGNVLVDIQDAFPDMISGYWIAVIIVGVPLLVLILSSQPWAKAWDDLQFTHGWQWRLFGWASVFWSFAAGIFGATHVFGWLWSAHTDFHHNINLLLFWPWDAFFIVSGIRWLLKGKFAARSKKWQMVVRAHAWSHVVLVGVYVIMVSLGLVTQNVSRVMTFMVPLVLLYNGLMLLSVERRTT